MSWKNTEEGMRRNTLLHERGLKKHVAYIRRAVRFTAAGRIEGGVCAQFSVRQEQQRLCRQDIPAAWEKR